MTAYELRISDWSSDVCSSDLLGRALEFVGGAHPALLVGQRDAQALPRVHAAARGFPADGLGLALGGALRRGFEAAMIAVGGRGRRAGNGLQRGGGGETRPHPEALHTSTPQTTRPTTAAP